MCVCQHIAAVWAAFHAVRHGWETVQAFKSVEVFHACCYAKYPPSPALEEGLSVASVRTLHPFSCLETRLEVFFVDAAWRTRCGSLVCHSMKKSLLLNSHMLIEQSSRCNFTEQSAMFEPVL